MEPFNVALFLKTKFPEDFCVAPGCYEFTRLSRCDVADCSLNKDAFYLQLLCEAHLKKHQKWYCRACMRYECGDLLGAPKGWEYLEVDKVKGMCCRNCVSKHDVAKGI